MESLYYKYVPKDPIANLKWRIHCRNKAMKDKKFQDALYQACMDDVLFFMGFACWGFDPRARVKVSPFVPFPHQERVFVAMDKAIDDAAKGEKPIDVILDKSRAQGGTFGYLWVDLRRWLRDPMFSAGYVTRNETLMDSKTDADTLFWKLDWAISRLPVWMLPKGFNFREHRSYTAHSLLNPENGASLVGYAAGQDVGAGGRKTVFTVDEAGARDFVAGGKDEAVQESLHDVTNCISGETLVVTPRGLVPISDIAMDDLVWDGTMWVSHDGCVYQGERETISAYGIRLTPDHQVLTTKGWKDASDRLDREEIRLPDGYRKRLQCQHREREVDLQMRLRRNAVCGGVEANKRGKCKLWLYERRDCNARHDWNADLLQLGSDDESLYERESSEICRLWRSGNNCLRKMAGIWRILGGYGCKAAWIAVGAARQQQWVLQGKLLLGNQKKASEKSSQQQGGRNSQWNDDAGGSGGNSRCNTRCYSVSPQSRLESERSTEKVYDLLNCGPRRAFTVIGDDGRPLLLHNCIRMVSARYLDQGVFHNACENPDPDDVHLILDWKDHPQHSKNAYVVRDGKPVACKTEEQDAVDAYHRENPDLRNRLERKGYKWEGIVRSPWYDRRCLRTTATPRLIAAQLDRNPRGAVGKVFTTDLLDRMKREHCKPPVWQGQPVFDSDTLELKGLLPRDDGPLKLWFKPGIDNSPPLGPFTLGCDIALGGDGAYSSNSVASGLDDRNGEQVLEYTVKGMDSIKFADVAIGLALWLRKAKLSWEDSGMSGSFAKQVMEVRYYGNVFFRDVTQLGSQKKSRKPGWPCRDNDKAEMFEKLALAMEMGKYIPRSDAMIMECGEYEWDKGKIIHAPTKNRGATEKNHGDRCIASAGCWLVFSTDNTTTNLDTDEESGQIPQYGSFLWREQQERRGVKSGSPRFGIRDVVGSF